jgi:hypothetical protein
VITRAAIRNQTRDDLVTDEDERREPLYRGTDRLLDEHGIFQRKDAERLDRYDVVMKHEFDRLDLTDDERGLISDVLATTRLSVSVILTLDDEVLDAMRSKRLAERWAVVPSSLAEKLRAMTTAQKCAIVEAFERGVLMTRKRTDGMNLW